MEISKERKEELLETHLLNYEMPDEQELAKLTLEELEFLIRSAEVHHKKKTFVADNFLKKIEVFNKILADKIKGGTKKGLEIVIEAVAVIFAVVVMVYGGFNIMGLTMAQTTASLPVTMGVVYTVLPLSGIVIAIYGVLNIIDLAHGKGLTLDEEN